MREDRGAGQTVGEEPSYVLCSMWSTFAKCDCRKCSQRVSGSHQLLCSGTEGAYPLFSCYAEVSHLKNCMDLTLKSWSETRWESCLNSIEPLCFHADKAAWNGCFTSGQRGGQRSVSETQGPVSWKERNRIPFPNMHCCLFWHFVCKINITSKHSQSVNMQQDVVVSLIDKRASLVNYRTIGCRDARTTAKELCETMNLFCWSTASTKIHFADEAANEQVAGAMKKLETAFISVVMNDGIQSLDDRFQMKSEIHLECSWTSIILMTPPLETKVTTWGNTHVVMHLTLMGES